MINLPEEIEPGMAKHLLNYRSEIIGAYRQSYRTEHGKKSPLTDEQIWEISRGYLEKVASGLTTGSSLEMEQKKMNIIISINTALRTRFKAVCTGNQDDENEVIIEAIEEYVNMYPELWPASTDDNSLEME